VSTLETEFQGLDTIIGKITSKLVDKVKGREEE